MFNSVFRKKSQKYRELKNSGDQKHQGGSRKADSLGFLTVTSKSMWSSLLKLFRKKALAEEEQQHKPYIPNECISNIDFDITEEEQQRKPYLPNECISNILIRLPVKSLRRLQLVCKTWYNIINDTYFVDAHLCCSETETVLIYLSSVPPSTRKNKELTLFSVEKKLLKMEPRLICTRPDLEPYPKRYIRYLEIKDGKLKVGDFCVSCFGEIKSSCNGLILILKERGLIVMNPVGRSILSVPLGNRDYGPQYIESYALVFSPNISKHKVVHLFFDQSRFLRLETIKIGIGDSWKLVKGPNIRNIMILTPQPVFAIGALHWIYQIYPNKFLMSMEIDKEKFQAIPLPNSNPNYVYGKILEMRGVLCYVAHEGKNQVDIWVLKGLCGENLVKHLSIIADYIIADLIPIFGSRTNEEITFHKRKDGCFYTCNLQKKVLTKVEIPKECASLWFVSELPHINSLVGCGAMDKFQEL